MRNGLAEETARWLRGDAPGRVPSGPGARQEGRWAFLLVVASSLVVLSMMASGRAQSGPAAATARPGAAQHFDQVWTGPEGSMTIHTDIELRAVRQSATGATVARLIITSTPAPSGSPPPRSFSMGSSGTVWLTLPAGAQADLSAAALSVYEPGSGTWLAVPGALTAAPPTGTQARPDGFSGTGLAWSVDARRVYQRFVSVNRAPTPGSTIRIDVPLQKVAPQTASAIRAQVTLLVDTVRWPSAEAIWPQTGSDALRMRREAELSASTGASAPHLIGVAPGRFTGPGGSFQLTVTADGLNLQRTDQLTPQDVAFRDLRVKGASVAPKMQVTVWPVRVAVQGASSTRAHAVVIVLDSSGSMSKNDPGRQRVEAARALVQGLGSGDRVAVLDFGAGTTAPYRASRLLQPFTTNRQAIAKAIDRTEANGGTPLYASLLDALDVARTATGTHDTSIVVLTDGQADAGDVPIADVEAAARAQGTKIFTVGLGGNTDVRALQGLASSTGGTFASTTKAAGLRGLLSAIGSGIGHGRVSVDARGAFYPSLPVGSSPVLTGTMVLSGLGGGAVDVPFSLMMPVATPKLAPWFHIATRDGTLTVYSDLPQKEAHPADWKSLVGASADAAVTVNGAPVRDAASVTETVGALLDALQAKGQINLQRDPARAYFGAAGVIGASPDYEVTIPWPVGSFDGRAAQQLLNGGFNTLIFPHKGLNDESFRRSLWRDTLLDLALDTTLSSSASTPAEKAAITHRDQSVLRSWLHSAAVPAGQAVVAATGSVTSFTSFIRVLSKLKGADKVATILDNGLAAWQFERASSATASALALGPHLSTVYYAAPFHGLVTRLGAAGRSLTIVDLAAKFTSDALDAIALRLALTYRAGHRLAVIKEFADQTVCNPQSTSAGDPAFCQGLNDAIAKYEKLRSSELDVIASTYLDANSRIGYTQSMVAIGGQLATRLVSIRTADPAAVSNAEAATIQAGAIVWTYKQFFGLFNDRELLLRSMLMAQFIRWIDSSGQPAAPSTAKGVAAWSESADLGRIRATASYMFLDYLYEAYSGNLDKQGWGSALKGIFVAIKDPGLLRDLKASRDRARDALTAFRPLSGQVDVSAVTRVGGSP